MNKLLFLLFGCIISINIFSMNLDDHLELTKEEVQADFRYALDRRDAKLLKSTILQGANVNEVMNEYNETPLMNMCSGKGDFNLIKLLVQGKADLSATSTNGNTALYKAIISGHWRPEVLNYLTESKASINAINNEGLTILDAAVAYGKVSLIKLLFKLGVDKKIQKDDCLMDFVQDYCHDHETIKLFLVNGFPAADHNKFEPFFNSNKLDLSAVQYSPIIWAAIFNEKELVEKYLNEGDDFHPANLSKDLVEIANERSDEQTKLLISNRIQNILDLIHSSCGFPNPLCLMIRRYLYNY